MEEYLEDYISVFFPEVNVEEFHVFISSSSIDEIDTFIKLERKIRESQGTTDSPNCCTF